MSWYLATCPGLSQVHLSSYVSVILFHKSLEHAITSHSSVLETLFCYPEWDTLSLRNSSSHLPRVTSNALYLLEHLLLPKTQQRFLPLLMLTIAALFEHLLSTKYSGRSIASSFLNNFLDYHQKEGIIIITKLRLVTHGDTTSGREQKHLGPNLAPKFTLLY